MNFFKISPRQDFASYSVVQWKGKIRHKLMLERHRKRASYLEEYLGNPPRKPARKGDFHASGSLYFFSEKAMQIIRLSSDDKCIISQVKVSGREGENIFQVWVTNFVDCLDIEKTVASPASGLFKKRIGVIKRPFFDESRWDGSNLFAVPQDPSYSLFCTERFIEGWKQHKLRGVAFSRFLMDPDEIRI